MALIDLTPRTTRISNARSLRFAPATWLAVWRTRRALNRLDSAALSDVGISHKAAQKEAQKPIWDVPSTWRN